MKVRDVIKILRENVKELKEDVKDKYDKGYYQGYESAITEFLFLKLQKPHKLKKEQEKNK